MNSDRVRDFNLEYLLYSEGITKIGGSLRIKKRIFFLVLILIGSTFVLQAHGSDLDEILFPSNVKMIEYKRSIEQEYDWMDTSFAYHFEETLQYEIIDVNLEENTFSLVLKGEISLIYFEGMELIAAEYTYQNNTKKRFPFSSHRSVGYSATRIVDLIDGKVMTIVNEENVPTELNFVYILEGESEESFTTISAGISTIGYIPSAWEGKYEEISSETIMRSVSAGKFECLISSSESDSEYYHTENVKYYEKKSGILISWEQTTTPNTEWSTLGLSVRRERKTELVKIEMGRSWDKILISESGQSSETSKVDESEQIWFICTYEYDGESFNNSNGDIYINEQKATWNDGQNRWELEVTSEELGIALYEVTSVMDEKYDVNQFEKIEPIEIEWKSAGIPGFPTLAITFGILFSLLLLKKFQS